MLRQTAGSNAQAVMVVLLPLREAGYWLQLRVRGLRSDSTSVVHSSNALRLAEEALCSWPSVSPSLSDSYPVRLTRSKGEGPKREGTSAPSVQPASASGKPSGAAPDSSKSCAHIQHPLLDSSLDSSYNRKQLDLSTTTYPFLSNQISQSSRTRIAI